MISSMNKSLISILFSFVPLLLFAQSTNYYKLVKYIHNGTSSTNVSGGQFITFISDICYESDKKGIGVGHGTLTRCEGYSTSNIKTYLGKSYWGNDAVFKFTSDFGALNIVTENGDVYLYKRSTAPSGVVTCSLIRRPSNSSESSSYVPSNPVQPTYPNGGDANNGNGYVGGGNVGNNNENRKQKPTRHQCSLCNGTGKIVRESSIATFGNDTQVYCSVCGRSYFRSTGHSHVTCPTCHGKGYVEYRL